MNMRMFGLAALLALAACGREEATKREQPVAVEAPRADMAWSRAGAGLTLRDAGGGLLLSLTCEGAPPRMTVSVPGFREIGSEERLSFGADDEPFVFVAQLGQQSGVRGEAAIYDDLLQRLARANTVGAVYGAQRLGPVAAPSAEQAAAFAAACRAIAG
jgi:hypothetical protein